MEVKDKVKQRRLERLRHLRESAEAGYGMTELPYEQRATAGWEPPAEAPAGPQWQRLMEDPELAWRHKFRTDMSLSGGMDDRGSLLRPPSAGGIALKLLISALLFAGVWGLFQLKHPWADKGKTFVVASLTTSYDFTAMSLWYEQRFGGSPSFIPGFHAKEGQEAIKASASNRTYFKPSLGAVVKPYNGSTQLGVVLRTQADAPVYALDTGQVIFSGMREGSGYTIVILHPEGLQSEYGWVSEPHVEVNDWIKGGEVIGKVSASEAGSAESGGSGGATSSTNSASPTSSGGKPEGTLYFAVAKNGKPINPADVISFD